MGTWSSSLYGNDTTSDVKDTYTEYLLEQLSNQEALDKTLKDFEELIGDEEEPLFWFALAETQWGIGRLTPEVKEKALEWIEKEGGVSLWEGSGASSVGWKKTLTKLKEKLQSPMRKEKKMEKLNQDLWEVGDVYAYQFNKEELEVFGKYVIIQKTGASIHVYDWMTPEEATKRPTMMIVHVFNKNFSSMPTVEDAKELKLLPYREEHEGQVILNMFLGLSKKSHYPRKHLFYLGNAPVSKNKSTPCHDFVYWNQIDYSLNFSFSNFGDKKYEEVEEGLYMFKG